jgi:hypothetical protein
MSGMFDDPVFEPTEAASGRDSDEPAAGSTESTGLAGSDVEGVLNRVRTWLARFICPMDPRDLDLLALWIAHTYLVEEPIRRPVYWSSHPFLSLVKPPSWNTPSGCASIRCRWPRSAVPRC